MLVAKPKYDPASDLKIVECFATCHDSSGNTSDIAKGRPVVSDLIAHVEAEGEPFREEVLEAAAKVAAETGLAAVGTGLHQIRIQLSGLIVIAERNFVPGPANTRSHVRHPFPPNGGEVIDIVGGEGEWIGDAELDGVMTVEVVARTAADRCTGLYVQSESLAFVVHGSRNSSKNSNFGATGPRAVGSRCLRQENASSETSHQKAKRNEPKKFRAASHGLSCSLTVRPKFVPNLMHRTDDETTWKIFSP